MKDAFDPIMTRELFDRAQTVLSGRMPSTAPKLRSHPHLPLRDFVCCASRDCVLTELVAWPTRVMR